MAKGQRYGWCRVVGWRHGNDDWLTAAAQSARDHLVHLPSVGLSAFRRNATPSGAARR